jgi:hypothetical protein
VPVGSAPEYDDEARAGPVWRCPSSGPYVIPGGLSTLEIDREADTGTYHEPNIWMRHV